MLQGLHDAATEATPLLAAAEPAALRSPWPVSRPAIGTRSLPIASRLPPTLAVAAPRQAPSRGSRQRTHCAVVPVSLTGAAAVVTGKLAGAGNSSPACDLAFAQALIGFKRSI
jgi:hypothetical protein